MTKFAAYGAALRVSDGVTGAAKTLTVAVCTSNVATFTTSAAHGLVAGDLVLVEGVTPSAYNGYWYVISAPTTTTFTADIGSDPADGSAFGTATEQGAFATIAQVRGIEGASLSAETADVTTHDSTAGWREFVATLIAGGEVTLDLVYDPDSTTQDTLRTDLVARTGRDYVIVFPDSSATTWNFRAFPTEFKPNAPVEGELSASVTLNLSGQPSLT